MRLRHLVPLGVVVLALACGGGAASTSSAGSRAASTAVGGSAGPAVKFAAPADTSVLPPAPAPSGRLIRNARVGLEVGSGRFDDTLNALIALADREHGFVAGSDASTTEGRLRSGVFTFSVPSDRFEAALGEVRRLGTVQSIAVSSQDVQAQYVDLQARLRNAEAQRDAMLALLQQARTVSDILAVQNQLGQVTAQIEQLKGQIDYLDHATAYSTITVSLREVGVARPASETAPLAGAVADGARVFLGSLAAILLVLVAVGPYLVVVGAGLLVWRSRRRRTEVPPARME